MSSHNDLRQRITTEIVESIRAGCPVWRKPWSSADPGLPSNVVSRRAYSGINVFALWAVSRERGYTSKFWGTYRQWAELGGQVRRRPDDISPGGWGCRIVYCKEITRNRATDEGERDEKYKLLRSYTVFSLDQVDGPALDHLRYKPAARPAVPDYQPAEDAIRATGADIQFGGDRAYYSRSGDYIQMPPRESFSAAHEFYQTAFHELAHWAERRLGWTGSYAMGELIAEIAGCFAASELAVPQTENLTNHVSYLAHWLKEIEADPLALTRAAAQASRVCDYLLGFSRPAGAEAGAAAAVA